MINRDDCNMDDSGSAQSRTTVMRKSRCITVLDLLLRIRTFGRDYRRKDLRKQISHPNARDGDIKVSERF